jgi:hypothetical protein
MSVKRFNQLIKELEEIVKGFEQEAPSARALNLRWGKVLKIEHAISRQLRKQDEIENPRPPSKMHQYEPGRDREQRRDGW